MKKCRKYLKKIVALLLTSSIMMVEFCSFTYAENVNEDNADLSTYFIGNKYEYFEGGISWYQAEQKCEEIGGHLVVISSEEEQEFLNMYMQSLQNCGKLTKQDVWIGGRINVNNNEFTWITGENTGYTNWEVGEPNHVFSMQDCVMMYTALSVNGSIGKWNDENGNGRDWWGYELRNIGYICEWENEQSEEENFDVTLYQASRIYDVCRDANNLMERYFLRTHHLKY